MPINYIDVPYHRHHNPPAIVMKVGDEYQVPPLTDQLRREYERLYITQVGNPAYNKALQDNINKVTIGAGRYIKVQRRTKVPWYIIGIMHLMECDCRFDCHLHNGDPLKARTVHVPKGRPLLKHWEWEDSAVDALQLEELDKWTDWGISGTLYKLESYNGFGSRNHGVPTAYLWSGTTFYKMGKYGSDGHWNPRLISSQTGAALVLKTLDSQDIIQFPKIIQPTTACEPSTN